MKDDRDRRLESILAELVGSSDEERDALLDRRCSDDEVLRRELETLLAAHEAAGALLLAGSGPDQERETELQSVESLPEIGSRIGPYQLARKLGEGGMGVVYEALQKEPIRRSVALKVIKRGLDTNEVVSRFESERQALALMDHPHIARVLDAGATQQGRPYFVMELVKGLPIGEYCDRRRLDTETRLRLFVQVCEALQHAHQKGVIHRDVKPSNVLVTEVDGKPVPKVIDFGVAKAVSQRLTERTLFTEHGALVGTPEYMSPEQAEATPLDVDTRTDIYSLGVVLYELLVGVLPLDTERLRRAAFHEILRIIREEEPPTPSARIRGLGETANEIASRRGVEVRELERVVGGELEWIVGRAIEKDRNRRYATASELAADIERYLGDEPVLARPPSASYRVKKLVRRHRVLVTAVAAVIAALALGLATSTTLYFKAATAEASAVWQSYLASMRAADLELQSNRPAQARRRLDSCPESLRGWEWSHLYLSTDTSVRTFPGYYSAFSPDGSEILTTDLETLYRWDAQSLELVEEVDLGTRIPPELSGDFRFRALSPDLRRATLYRSGQRPEDGEYLLVDLENGRLISDLPDASGLSARRGFHDFSIDGSLLMTRTKFGVEAPSDSIVLWNATDGQRLADLGGNPGSYPSGFLPYAPALVFLAPQKRPSPVLIEVWTAAGRQSRLEVERPARGNWIWGLAVSPDRRYVAVSGRGGLVELIDVEEGKATRRWKTEGDGSLTFSPDGRLLAWGSSGVGVIRGLPIRVWDIWAGNEIGAFRGSENGVASIGFSPDGRWLIVGSGDGYSRAWPTDGSGAGEIVRFPDKVESAGISPDGTTLYATTFSAYPSPSPTRVVDLASRRTLGFLDTTYLERVRDDESRDAFPFATRADGQLDTSSMVALSSDGRLLARALGTGGVRLWNLASLRKVGDLAGNDEFVAAVTFDPDGEWIAAAGRYGSVRIWAVADHRLVKELHLNEKLLTLAVSPDGRYLATGSDSGRVSLIDTGSWAIEKSVEAPGFRVATLAFGPASRALAGALVPDPEGAPWDPLVQRSDAPHGVLWTVPSLALEHRLEGHTHPIHSLAFTPDGSRIVSGSGDQSIRLWDRRTGDPVLVLEGHERAVTSVAVTASGRIVSGSSDSTVRFWDSSAAASTIEVRSPNETGASRTSAFSGVRWRAETPLVLLDGGWRELLAIQGVSTDQIIEFARAEFGPSWQIRFEEDLDVLIRQLGHEWGSRVTLRLRDDAGEPYDVETEATEENHREALKLARKERFLEYDPEQNPHYPRRSPFSGMRWKKKLKGAKPLVELEGTWHKLVAIEDVPIEEIVSFCRRKFQHSWRMFLQTGLVLVLEEMGVAVGDTVTVVLETEGREQEVTVELTEENWHAVSQEFGMK